MLKRMKAHKYQSNVQAKAAYLASRPKDSTYKVDETEEVFANPIPAEGEGEGEKRVVAKPLKQRKRKTTAERKKAKKVKTAGLAAVGRAKDGGGSGADDD